MLLSVVVTRTSLALADLTIPGFPTAGLWVPSDGLERPPREWTRTTVTSPFTHGSVTTRATLDQSQISLSVYAQGTSTATLNALMDEVEATFSQFVYDVTLTIDGQSKTYSCDAANVSWGPADPSLAQAYLARATLTIPCHPIAGGGGATAGLYVVAPTVPMP